MTSPPFAADLATRQFEARFGGAVPPQLLSAPGRINLMGEHIDYHGLSVLPMAIQRRIWMAFRPRVGRITAVSAGGYAEREFALSDKLEPTPPGDWVNYLKAAVQAIGTRWRIARGLEASIASDLPAAAGLSSSSALLIAFTLALLEVNSILATKEELMAILPEGEQFVGTRGGAMDHAVILAAREASALLVGFNPFSFTPLAVPRDWCFLIAHSLTVAEKSGVLRAEYNARRTAGERALRTLGFASYRSALQNHAVTELEDRARCVHQDGQMPAEENRAFLHVIEEAARIDRAVKALQAADADAFGRLLLDSHASLRDRLRVSSAALDELVEKAMRAGALGARLTGAGFGGCVIALCRATDRDRVCARLIETYYSSRPEFVPRDHLIAAEPSAGALYEISEIAAASQYHLGVRS